MTKKVLVVVGLIVAVNIIFAGGIALSGVGTRAKSMGGAMRGLADDPSAMYWNPAGISFLNESTITVGIHYVDFNGEYENEAGTVFENEDVLNIIPSLVYAKACPDKPWNFGFGVYVPFGLSAEWDIFDFAETMPIDTDGDGVPDTDYPLNWEEDLEDNEKSGSLMVIDFHPTWSYMIDEYLSVGMGISMDYAHLEIGMIEEHPLYGEYLPTYTYMKGDGVGYGFNYGFMFKPNDKLSLGFSGRTESILTLNGDADIDTYINDVIGSQMETPMAATVINNNPDVEAAIVLPADWGFGFGYKIKKNWLIAADFTYTGWESVDVIDLNFEEGFDILGNPITDSEMVLDWEDTIRMSIGTEYLMGKWAYRAGYYYDESPLIDETMKVTFPDFYTKNALNFGFGYMINEKICLDMGVEYILFEESC